MAKTFKKNTNVYDKDIELANQKMVGWTIVKVEGGLCETLFIIHLEKDKNKRIVRLCGNDLGGWIR